MVRTLPVLLALTSGLFLGERLRALEWGMLSLFTIGAGMISLSPSPTGPQASTKGDLLVVLPIVAAVAMTLFTQETDGYL